MREEIQKRKTLQDRRSEAGCRSKSVFPQQKGKFLFTVGPTWNWFAQSRLILECDICPHHKTTGYNVSDIIPNDITPPNDIIINPKWGSHHWAAFSKCSWNSFYRTRGLCAKRRGSHEAGGVSSGTHVNTTLAELLAGNFFFLYSSIGFYENQNVLFFHFSYEGWNWTFLSAIKCPPGCFFIIIL